MRQRGAHRSMLSRKGSHISTHAASIPALCRALNSVLKNSSRVSFFLSRPNHSGSPLSRLLATVRNFCFLPRWISSTPSCRSAGFRRWSAQRSRYRKSMDRTVVAATSNCLATRRAAALSQASPTASSNRLLNGALLGNCSTFSALIPQSRQRKRYNSTTIVVRYSKHDRSRTSRSLISAISTTVRPQPEHTSLPPFAAHPQLQRLGVLVDFTSIHPIARPAQNLRPVIVSQTAQC